MKTFRTDSQGCKVGFMKVRLLGLGCENIYIQTLSMFNRNFSVINDKDKWHRMYYLC